MASWNDEAARLMKSEGAAKHDGFPARNGTSFLQSRSVACLERPQKLVVGTAHECRYPSAIAAGRTAARCARMACVSGAVRLSQNIEIERRLAAVLAADVAGYSRLTEADEIGTMRMLAAQRAKARCEKRW